MKLPTFIGGIHPPDGKELTSHKEIEIYNPQGDLVFPMSQHLGVPCTPIVKKGDRVLVGQKIGDSDAFVSAPIANQGTCHHRRVVDQHVDPVPPFCDFAG